MAKERRNYKPDKRGKYRITKEEREEAGKGKKKRPQPDLIRLLPYLEGKRLILTVPIGKGKTDETEK